MNSKQILCKHVNRLLRERNITKSELAEGIGMDKSNLGKMLNNESKIPVDYIEPWLCGQLPANENRDILSFFTNYYSCCLRMCIFCSTFVGGMRKVSAYIIQQACRMFCLLGVLCGLCSCGWKGAKEVIATADKMDQTEHVVYDDTAALAGVICKLDNPIGRLFCSNTLGKAYYYMGRYYCFLFRCCIIRKFYVILQ